MAVTLLNASLLCVFWKTDSTLSDINSGKFPSEKKQGKFDSGGLDCLFSPLFHSC